MKESNIHPIFENLLTTIAPPKDVSASDSLLKMAEQAIRDNGVLLSGFNQIVAALNSAGTTMGDIREISIDTLSKVGK